MSGATARNDVLVDFFSQLADMPEILRAMVPSRDLRVLVQLRGEPERTVFLDFSVDPIRVEVDSTERNTELMVLVEGEVMHAILRRELKAGEAFGQRRLLLRGTIAFLVHILPLLDFAPELYADHLNVLQGAAMTSMTRSSSSSELEQRRRDRVVAVVANTAAWSAGFAVGRFRRAFPQGPGVMELLARMSEGLRAANDARDADA